ncbi:hypothetical protein Bbelb_271850 [Branchiostoma belcheri]|nr:hypothetical protein Bbelb_271850 [Branchiostoma belcheri]
MSTGISLSTHIYAHIPGTLRKTCLPRMALLSVTPRGSFTIHSGEEWLRFPAATVLRTLIAEERRLETVTLAVERLRNIGTATGYNRLSRRDARKPGIYDVTGLYTSSNVI